MFRFIITMLIDMVVNSLLLVIIAICLFLWLRSQGLI